MFWALWDWLCLFSTSNLGDGAFFIFPFSFSSALLFPFFPFLNRRLRCCVDLFGGWHTRGVSALGPWVGESGYVTERNQLGVG